MRIFIKIALTIFLLFFISNLIFSDIKPLRESLSELNFSKVPVRDIDTLKYFNIYSLRFDNTEHYLGYFKSGGYIINANVYKVQNPRGTVILSHGYLSHSALMSYFIRFFIEQNYNVAAFDMPGHGLSNGARASINDFNKYGIVLRDFVNIVSDNLSGPYTLVGHSMGCAAIFEYLRCFDSGVVDNIVLTAPLVRLVWFHSTKYAGAVYDIFSDTIGRIYRDSSSDEQYKYFIKNKDPLTIKKVPLAWTEALYKWLKEIKHTSLINRKILIIQGLEDSIVDYKYNIKFLNKKIKEVNYVELKNAKHDLLNEKRKIRTKVYNIILNYINTKN